MPEIIEPLTGDRLVEALRQLPDWQHEDGALQHTARFPAFADAVAFVVRVGFLAESQRHHPDLTISYNIVTLRLRTHDAGDRVTERDVRLARAIDRLLR